MRRFSFVMNPVMKFPWEIFMFLCGAGTITGILLKNIHAILPSLVGALICFSFYAMKRFSHIFVTDRSIRIRLGIFAYGEIAFSNIANVGTAVHKAIHGIGVKACEKGEMGVVTTAGEVVRLGLKQKDTLRLFGFMRVSFCALRLSPEKQDEFIAMVKERIGREQ